MLPMYSLCFDCEVATRSCTGARAPLPCQQAAHKNRDFRMTCPSVPFLLACRHRRHAAANWYAPAAHPSLNDTLPSQVHFCALQITWLRSRSAPSGRGSRSAAFPPASPARLPPPPASCTSQSRTCAPRQHSYHAKRCLQTVLHGMMRCFKPHHQGGNPEAGQSKVSAVACNRTDSTRRTNESGPALIAMSSGHADCA